MIARILSFLFPPKLPGRIHDWPEPEPTRYLAEEQGWAGNVKRRFTGIEKHWMMDREPKIYRVDRKQYRAQLLHAEKHMVALEKDLIAQGYVNTIHDCWEKVDDLGELQQRTLAGPPRK